MSQPKAVTSLIDEGLAAQQSGDVSGARGKYEAALGLSPDDPEALHLLGLVHEHEKDRERAIELIERAIAIDPLEPIFRINLAAILEKNRQFDSAVEHMRATVVSRPNSSDLTKRLGAIELARGDAQAAADSFRRAYELDRQNISALAGYGRAMLMMNNIADARRAMQAVLAAPAVDTDGLELAIRIAAVERDGAVIGQLANRWKTLKANDQESLSALANLLFNLSYMDEACNAFEAVIKLDPASAETLVAYGRYCTAAQRFDEANEAIDKALKINPESVTGRFALGRLKYFEGDLQSAEELCDQVVAADPNFSPALNQLCSIRRGDMSDENVAAMNSLVEKTSTPPDQAYELLLSLSKIYDRRKNINESFKALERGNEFGEHNIQATGICYDQRQNTRETDQIMSFFPGRGERPKIEPGPYTPVFIVGMPRSGTTLTESILAAHPDTFSVGELSSLPEVYKRVLDWARQTGAATIADAPTTQLQTWRDLYFSYYPSDNSEKFLVDKQPINFRHAGLIRALFPEGKIVHIRRNPVETGFSIYRHPFNKDWLFAFQLENIAHFYGDYARLVAHWENSLTADFPLFQYEILIEAFEEQVRRMLAHCGLDWREECLSFHRAERPIATFSSVQARQPVKKAPDRAAQRYLEHLSPLLDGLKAAKIDLETGALNKRSAN